MKTLFNITSDLQALDDLLFEVGGDINEETVAAVLDAWFIELEGDLVAKVEGYCCFIKELELRAANRKREAERMRKLAKSDENTVKGLKTRMQQALDFLGRTRVDTDMFRVTVAKNGGKQPMTLDETIVPEEFRTTVITQVPNKELIRHRLESGESLSFATLHERGRSLRIG